MKGNKKRQTNVQKSWDGWAQHSDGLTTSGKLRVFVVNSMDEEEVSYQVPVGGFCRVGSLMSHHTFSILAWNSSVDA